MYGAWYANCSSSGFRRLRAEALYDLKVEILEISWRGSAYVYDGKHDLLKVHERRVAFSIYAWEGAACLLLASLRNGCTITAGRRYPISSDAALNGRA